MRAEIAIKENIEQIAKFLAKCNNKKTQNVGFVGDNEKGIIAALHQDFLKTNEELAFAIMKDDMQKIIGAIGLDIDDKTAEVWGPFSECDGFDIENELWNLLLQKFSHLQQFQFFIHVKNEQQQVFITQLGAKKTGENRILSLKREHFSAKDKVELQLYKPNNFANFEKLHNETFPNAYYDAKTIVSRISKNYQLLILMENEMLIGYAYFEVEPLFGEASLEFIAIHPQYQNKGYGTKFLNAVINEMFKFPELDDLILCVSNSNSRANRVYEKVGFQNESELRSYTLTLV